jgi:hypothetical protein
VGFDKNRLSDMATSTVSGPWQTCKPRSPHYAVAAVCEAIELETD